MAVKSNTQAQGCLLSNQIAVIAKMLYSPSIGRKRSSDIELKIKLPAASITTLSLDFDFAFIKVTEHHPDANHGFDIG
jgi:phosphatidylinositol glycan class T